MINYHYYLPNVTNKNVTGDDIIAVASATTLFTNAANAAAVVNTNINNKLCTSIFTIQ